MVARFQGRNPRAEQWLLTQSSTLITRITNDTRDGVRFVLQEGMRLGRGPRSVALDIVGRMDRAAGRRVGGLVGLTPGDVASSQRALGQLTSGDPAEMAKYLRRKLRDKRFDATVARAIREGKPVPADRARKIVGRYQDRLLYRRGETIARTELLQSLHHAQDEGLRQLVDDGKLNAGQITREWDASEDSDTRDSHRHMDGQSVGLNEPFTSGNGALMMHPGDSSLGAGPEEIINCRCIVRPKIDFIAGLKPGD